MKPRGLTLAELMLSLGIASCSVLLIFEMVTAGLSHYRKLEVIGTTQALAEGKMEEVVATNITSLVASGGDFPPPHADYHYEVQVADHGPSAVKNVNVTVSHKAGTRRTLSTMRAPNSTPPGLALFFSQNCNTCHSITGLNSAPPGMAPDLTTIGLQPQSYIRTSITAPSDGISDATDPAYAFDSDGDGHLDTSNMDGQTTGITPDQVDSLVQWLYSLH